MFCLSIAGVRIIHTGFHYCIICLFEGLLYPVCRRLQHGKRRQSNSPGPRDAVEMTQ